MYGIHGGVQSRELSKRIWMPTEVKFDFIQELNFGPDRSGKSMVAHKCNILVGD